MKKELSVDKKVVMVEEWKARRKEVEEKEVEKKGKGKKWFWEKSFLLLFDCAPSLLPCTNHTITQHNMMHWCTPSHANRAVCCAALFLGVDSKTHCIIHTPHSIT